MSSDIALPVAGALRMPQQVWPHATYAFGAPGICPITGKPSAELGKKHAVLAFTGAAANLEEAEATSLRTVSASTSSGRMSNGSAGNFSFRGQPFA
eukprot:CAMPEP_0180518618 /NCGR_PEP_ID=MMETSP1036_2-20121128/55201_1 /TAXON_ID=632150 /ORGANISM="Azadinium spinosum, Strain 3D9" /LENGTH=95 /DNA_ID=CAMNT_0022530803 /DNA_START=32 /DNA_END=319 /DNA_ORIENTATION=-